MAPVVEPGPTKTVSWEQALVILNQGNVVSVYQAHSRHVGLTLRDGMQYETRSRQLDDIVHAVGACEKCGEVAIVME